VSKQKLIIDTDPGVDDAMAILYAAISPDIDLLGLTTIFGNVTTAIATRNALTLSEMCGQAIPVAEGAAKPLVQPQREPAWEVHGRDGFGDLPPFSPNQKKQAETAPEFICRIVNQHPGEVILCPVGPLTNIALALHHDPSITHKVKSVTIMGGSMDEGGNVTRFAEANIWQDPHAADEVFQARWPMTMVGLDVTHRVICTPEDFADLKTSAPVIGGFLNDAAQFYFQFHRKVDGIHGCHMHDPSAVISIVRPNLFQIDPTPVGVIVEGEEIGRTIASALPNRAAVSICRKVDAQGVRTEFLKTIKSAF